MATRRSTRSAAAATNGSGAVVESVQSTSPARAVSKKRKVEARYSGGQDTGRVDTTTTTTTTSGVDVDVTGARETPVGIAGGSEPRDGHIDTGIHRDGAGLDVGWVGSLTDYAGAGAALAGAWRLAGLGSGQSELDGHGIFRGGSDGSRPALPHGEPHIPRVEPTGTSVPLAVDESPGSVQADHAHTSPRSSKRPRKAPPLKQSFVPGPHTDLDIPRIGGQGNVGVDPGLADLAVDLGGDINLDPALLDFDVGASHRGMADGPGPMSKKETPYRPPYPIGLTPFRYPCLHPKKPSPPPGDPADPRFKPFDPHAESPPDSSRSADTKKRKIRHDGVPLGVEAVASSTTHPNAMAQYGQPPAGGDAAVLTAPLPGTDRGHGIQPSHDFQQAGPSRPRPGGVQLAEQQLPDILPDGLHGTIDTPNDVRSHLAHRPHLEFDLDQHFGMPGDLDGHATMGGGMGEGAGAVGTAAEGFFDPVAFDTIQQWLNGTHPD